MISNAVIQNTIDELKEITGTEYSVYDESCRKVASTQEKDAVAIEKLKEFFQNDEDDISFGKAHAFKVRDDGECIYILTSLSVNADSYMMGRVALVNLNNLLNAYTEKLSKTSFFQNLILDNMLLVDIHNKATKLHIENEVKRIVYLVETGNDTDGIAQEVLKSMYLANAGNQIISVDEQNIILIKDLPADSDREDIYDIAEAILDTLNTEAMLKVRVSYGLAVKELKDISKSYKEAKMALEVGSIFYSSKTILSYENLGIGRLIYQLPVNLCELFVKEVFGDSTPEEIDEETLSTVYKFFENNLNVSETSRQLYIHRNTLVYRMEKLQKTIGLDMRVFEDALTFKIAMMVVDYVNYLHNRQD